VRLLDAVRPGQLLGCVRDLVGATVEEVHAVEEGIVVMLHAFPVVAPGDSVCVLARPEPEC
jgi:predicted deacylase